MQISALPRLLTQERHRQRAAPKGGFSVPVVMERQARVVEEPLVASTSKGHFLRTSRTKEGLSRYAFFPCTLEEEPFVVPRLHASLRALSVQHGWGNGAPTLQEGVRRLSAGPLKPSAIVISPDLLASVCGESFTQEETTSLMAVQGYIAKVEGIRVLIAPLLAYQALVATSPETLGVYTRVGDYLGLQLFNVTQHLVVVDHGLA